MEHTEIISPSKDTSTILKAIDQIADHEVVDNEQNHLKKTIEESAAIQKNTAQIHHWFFTFMCMNIPVIGWFYLWYLAFNKKHPDRRNFARAYLFYKLVFLILGIIIWILLIHIGLNLLEQLLAYMEML